MLETIGTSVLVLALYACLVIAIVETMNWWERRREAKIARIEADLDQVQARMRATILDLASQLGADAHEARKALIRESFLVSRDESTPPR
ncbi:hypothetical protein [Parafrigoribacterium humi]|uniref:hypothetical protein n=1 Tax=Parafrigoribacterium humi TaxID=3144664 RepID=UPI0032EE8141